MKARWSIGLCLALLAGPVAAEDWQQARARFLKELGTEPAIATGREIAREIDGFRPQEDRLSLALAVSSAAPMSAALAATVARAYSALGLRQAAAEAAEDLAVRYPREAEARSAAAEILSGWEFWRQAAPHDAWLVRFAEEPDAFLPAGQRLGEASSRLADPSLVDPLRAHWQAQVSSGSLLVKPYLLLAQFYEMQRQYQELRTLCAAALRRFPDEGRLYESQARALAALGDLPGLVRLRLERVAKAPAPSVGDYLDLADAYALEGQADAALQALRRGLGDARLDAQKKSVLADRLPALRRRCQGLARPEPVSACRFEEDARRRSVSCGSGRLSYDPVAGSFSGVSAAAQAAALACRLMERTEELRFADRQAAAGDQSLREKLRAAGYLGD